mmetsp:Transcript_26351/g.61126  ORF Transcript_26351/g.61126 Transcript_26351/m.61126 type:complete len:571 (-) Transcript_26351:227-1939(-)
MSLQPKHMVRQTRRTSLRIICPALLLLVVYSGISSLKAFCEAALKGPARPSSSVRNAEARENPVKELQEKVAAAIGRKPTKRDMVWRYQATLALPCLENVSLSVQQVTIDGKNTDECRRKAAAAVLAVLDLDKVEGEATAASASARKEKIPKKASKQAKKGKNATVDAGPFEIGQSVTGTVTQRISKGLYVDIHGRQAFLPAAEICEGFPDEVPPINSTVTARIMTTGKIPKVSQREGSLERPVVLDSLKADPSVFNSLDVSTKVDAEVIGIIFDRVFLKITSPTDPSKATIADLEREDIEQGFETSIRLGCKLQVRRKYSKGDRTMVSMKPAPELRAADLAVGDTLVGIVRSRPGKQRSGDGVFVDVGVDRPAYMDWQECHDGYNIRNVNNLRRGNNVSVRVLKVEEDRVYVTRRSGDLYRASLDGKKLPETSEDIISKFAELPTGQELDASVFRLFPRFATVIVSSPDGAEAQGKIPRKFFSASFREKAAPGLKIKVCRLEEQRSLTSVMLKLADWEDTDGKETNNDEVPEANTPDTPQSSGQAEEEQDPASKAESGPLEGLADFLMR